MTAYAIAHLRSVDFGADIIRYLEKIDETLVPHEGRFLVHGVNPEVLEGPFPGNVIVIEFPDIERARGWYYSPGYREILPLRTDNSEGATVLVEGVRDGYRATDYLAKVMGRG